MCGIEFEVNGTGDIRHFPILVNPAYKSLSQCNLISSRTIAYRSYLHTLVTYSTGVKEIKIKILTSLPIPNLTCMRKSGTDVQREKLMHEELWTQNAFPIANVGTHKHNM